MASELPVCIFVSMVIGMSSTRLATSMSLGLINVAIFIAYFFTDLRKGTSASGARFGTPQG